MEQSSVSIKKNIVWNSVGTFVMFFCQWLMMVLVVRLSGYSDSGILSLSVSCGNVFLIIAAFGVKTFQVSDVKDKYKDGEYYGAKLITILFTVAAGLVWTFVSSYEGVEKTSILLYMVYIMVYSYSDAVYGALQKKWRLDIAGISMCIRNIAALVIFCLVIWLTKEIRYALVAILAASLAVLFFYDLPAAKRVVSIRPVIRGKRVWLLLWECFPFAIYTFLHTLLLTVPKLSVREFYDKETLGIYSAVMAPVAVLQVAATFVINPLSTLLAARIEEGKIHELMKILGKCFLMLFGILAAGILIALFLGEWGLGILYGEDTKQYSFLLVPMVIVSVLTALTILLGNLAIVMRDRKGANISAALGLAAAFGASFLLIPSIGM
ncbi:MAG: oligosaccharide flippase family protein [Parasporobacterium sp.]|nr:oligosaccharide flippase family protein [Parasporobacterium sp.]